MIIGIDASRVNIREKTGVEWYAYHIIAELKEVIPSDITVVLYSREPLDGVIAELPPNWSNRVLRWPPKFLWTQVRLSIEMFFRSPDILFIPSSAPPILHPERTIVTVHDVAARDNPESFSIFQKWYSLFTARYALGHCSDVIVPSVAVADEVRSMTKKINSNISIIYHGFVRSEWSNGLDLTKFGISKSYILSIGRIETKKNIVRLMDSFDVLRESGRDVQLVLVGSSGEGDDLIRERAVRSPFVSDIVFTGYVDEDVKYQLLAGARVFVFVSIAEGFGFPLLEAFSMMAPVVAGDISVLREIGADACIYVDPHDTDDVVRGIVNHLEDIDMRNTYIERGVERLSEFSWRKCAESTFHVIMST
jgi:glycosyltransferase involved in cell wall biosynthesis